MEGITENHVLVKYGTCRCICKNRYTINFYSFAELKNNG